MYRLPLVFLLMVALSVGLLNCGGGSDGGSGSSGALKDTSRIVGTVEELILASNKSAEQSIALQIKNYLIFINDARAAGEELCGIVVKAIQDGEVVADAVTDCEGNFELVELLPGLTTLMFQTDLFNDTIEMIIPAGGIVTMKVSLDDDEETDVTVNEINIITGPVSCAEGTVNLGSDDINQLTIAGNGNNCVSAEGSCNVNILGENVNLNGCNICVAAGDNAAVLISANGAINCSSESDGVNTGGGSTVDLEAEECNVESQGTPIVEEGDSVVNTEGCGEIDLEDLPGGDGEEGGDTEEGGEGEEGGGGEEGGEDEDHFACEYDCIANECDLFCTDSIPDECVNFCSASGNFSDCIADCADLACGNPVCQEVCFEDQEPVCEIIIEEECDEVCEGECEEVCVEFRKEEVLNFDCFEECINGECEGLEGGAREECVSEHEALCAGECTELVETDDCLEFEVVGCECEEVCEEVEVEVCEGECIEGLSCRFECEEINL